MGAPVNFYKRPCLITERTTFLSLSFNSSFVDAAEGHIVTAVSSTPGSADITTADSVAGGGCVVFTSINSYLTTDDDPDWQLGTAGTGPFEIDLYFKVTSFQVGGAYLLFQRSTSVGDNNRWALSYDDDSFLFNVTNAGSNALNPTWSTMPYTSAMTTGVWYHFNLVRCGNTEDDWTCTLNGVTLNTSGGSRFNGTIPDIDGPLTIAASSFYGSMHYGFIDELNISNLTVEEQAVNFYSNGSLAQTEYVPMSTSYHGGEPDPLELGGGFRVHQLVVDTCSVKAIMVDRKIPPGTGKSIKFHLFKNDVPTDLHVTIKNGETTNLTTGDVSLVAGDQIYTKTIYYSSDASITYSTAAFYNVSYVIDGGGIQNFFSINQQKTMSTNNFARNINNAYLNTQSGTPPITSFIFPTAGTIRKGYFWAEKPVFQNDKFGIIEKRINLSTLSGSTDTIFLIQDTNTSSITTNINTAVAKHDDFSFTDYANFNSDPPTDNGNAFHNYGVTFEASDGGTYVYGVGNELTDTSSPIHIQASGMYPLASQETSGSFINSFITMPIGGVITNIVGRLASVTGSAKTVTITLQKNSVNTALSFSFSSNTLYEESVGSVSVTTGDKLSFVITSNPTDSGLPYQSISWTFVSDIPNYYPVFFSNSCDTTAGTLPTTTVDSTPINFYSVP